MKLGPKMRINANLVSTENENSIWSNNFDLSVDQIFDVQDEIAEQIVSTIVGRVKSEPYKDQERVNQLKVDLESIGG